MGIYIDNKYYKDFNEKATILQFCLSLGIQIPFFCYHERLNIAGNCRMCLVELNNLLVPSCAINLNDNMVIFTKNKRVSLARESVLEFLLVNHPLDCPICDQGGECDLQDLTLTYGSDNGRFYEFFKRSVDNLNACGPLIKTIMTRCIHCTRCVRFVNEVSANNSLGVIGRGNSMEIGTYIENFVNDELIGNIIDLCPVGALTSMPFSFTTRAWKLLSIRSIDVLDSIASSIRIDIFSNKVMRILPSLDGIINEEWITNKTRFSYDSLSIQRLNYPKVSFNKKFVIISWHIAFDLYLTNLNKFKFDYIQAICGPFLDLEATVYFKRFFNSFGCSNLNYFENSLTSSIYDFRFFFLLNKIIIELENLNNIIFIGTNLRMELPLLNVRIRKNYMEKNDLNIYSIGLALDYSTYPIKNLGNSTKTLLSLLEGKFSYNFLIFFYDLININFLNKFKIRKIYFFIGMSILNRIDSNNIIYSLLNLFDLFKFYNFEHLNTISKFLGRISCFEIGLLNKGNFNSHQTKIIKFNHYCGVDLDVNKIYILNDKDLNIYQGYFHINFFIKYLWLIFPVYLFTEASFTYLNLEGRYRMTQQAINPSVKLFTDGDIFKILFLLKNVLIENNFSIIKDFNLYFNKFKKFINYYYVFYIKNSKQIQTSNLLNKFQFKLKFPVKFINSLIYKNNFNFNLTDPITRNSKIMNLSSLKIKIMNFN